jgi:hypothetical protein
MLSNICWKQGLEAIAKRKLKLHYSGYSKFSVEPHSNYEFDGLTIENNSSDEFHIFLKKLDNVQVSSTEISNDHHPHCCCLTCLEGKY